MAVRYSSESDLSDTTTKPGGMTDLHELSGFQRSLLVVIAGNPGIHGLGTGERLEEHYGEISASRLYPNLAALHDAGLVCKDSVDGRTDAYRVTDAGERALGAWLGWLEDELG